MKNDFLSADRCFKLSAVSSELFKTKTVASAAASQQARHDICSPLALRRENNLTRRSACAAPCCFT